MLILKSYIAPLTSEGYYNEDDRYDGLFSPCPSVRILFSLIHTNNNCFPLLRITVLIQ
jgi:hypothetical protein